MANHEDPCDYCGEDTRGLCGVKGCNSQKEAQKCHSYQEMIRKSQEQEQQRLEKE